MDKVFKELLSSKKFWVLVVGVVAIVVLKSTGNLDQEVLAALTALFSSYQVGQGIADKGKGAAKAELELLTKVVK